MKLTAILLLLVSLALAFPTGFEAEDESHAIVNFNTSSPLETRTSTSVTSSNDEVTVRTTMDDGVGFDACHTFKNKKTCGFVYIERNTWGNKGTVWAYDTKCNQVGLQLNVERSWLANRWSFRTSLPYSIDLRIPSGWKPYTGRPGPELWYGNKYDQPWFWIDNWPAGDVFRADYVENYLLLITPFDCS